MKYLIVNADDFGLSEGINAGIARAHEHGVVTSASLMVDRPAAEQAASLIADLTGLSVGLHVEFTDEWARPLIEIRKESALDAELCRQHERFRALVRREPDHLDSHHNVHFLADAAPRFAALAETLGIFLRGFSPIRYFPDFYGQWDGESHLDHIGVESLNEMLGREVAAGFTELGCHPGYADAALDSTYATERETELRTLCDERVRTRIDELGIELIASSVARDRLALARAEG